MKAHEYLWEYMDFQNKNPGISDLEAQGHVRQYLGDEQLFSDSSGEVLTEREVRSILGRNEKYLRQAYADGNKPLFAAVCMYQQMSDDEWHAEKAKAEAAAEADAAEDPAQDDAPEGEGQNSQAKG